MAIGAFATSEIVFIKQLGLGTALAVLIATLIRALLAPALLALNDEARPGARFAQGSRWREATPPPPPG